ncbi:hypothetical protein VNI00_018607 [Paramarasmius palmivorus]|uniref:CCHC-type domain-containing protein n=1 Tax=Paramarasmius palmivorus TaxID=297713 RepID=A0AAW0AWC6_9AGAR
MSTPRRSPRKPRENASKVQRKECMCQKCPGKGYLQRECPVHSAKATRERNAREKRDKLNLQYRPSTTTPVGSGAPVGSQEKASEDQAPEDPASCNRVEQDVSIQPSPTADPPAPNVEERRVLVGMASDRVTTPKPRSSPQTDEDCDIDPALLPTTPHAPLIDPDNPLFTSGPDSSPGSPFSGASELGPYDQDSASISSTSSPSGTPSKSRGPRVRASLRNPIFGMVEGVQRGEEIWKIARVHALNPQLPTVERIHKRYDEKLSAILCRCEELASETGAWLYLSAQVPTRGVDLVHYASKRLRKEAPDALDRIYNLNLEVVQALVNSKRRDVLQAEMELARARAAEEAAKASEATLRADMESLTRANEEKDMLITNLRALLGPSVLSLLGPGTTMPPPSVP